MHLKKLYIAWRVFGAYSKVIYYTLIALPWMVFIVTQDSTCASILFCPCFEISAQLRVLQIYRSVSKWESEQIKTSGLIVFQQLLTNQLPVYSLPKCVSLIYLFEGCYWENKGFFGGQMLRKIIYSNDLFEFCVITAIQYL